MFSVPAVCTAVSYTHLDVYKRQIIEEVTWVNVMVIVTGEAKEEAIGETKMNIGPR